MAAEPMPRAAPRTATPLLKARDLVAGYGAVEVLHGIDLDVLPGTIETVVGANGAGKTTLLRTLSGLLRPTAGTIEFEGQDLRGVPVHRMVHRGIAHVPEGRGVIAELTVEENLRLGGVWRRDHEDAARALEEVYDFFPPLAERRRFAGHQLSGGERQMLAIGRALIARPTLMLLDEPSLGLAPRVIAQIMGLLRRLRDENGLTVLLVEQNVRSALSVADSAVVMSLGRVVVATDAESMRTDTNLRQAYLGS